MQLIFCCKVSNQDVHVNYAGNAGHHRFDEGKHPRGVFVWGSEQGPAGDRLGHQGESLFGKSGSISSCKQAKAELHVTFECTAHNCIQPMSSLLSLSTLVM